MGGARLVTTESAADPIDPVPAQHTTTRGPVTRSERSLAPDLARGTVLLFIALANVSTYFHDRVLEPGHRPVGGSRLDDVLDVVVATVVDRRSYPMFALLFGYGMVQIARRQRAAGASRRAMRTVLVRRNLALVVLGAVHALLLFDDDILGPYGAIGLVALVLLERSRRVLTGWIAGTTVSLALAMGATDAGTAGDVPRESAEYATSAIERIASWGVGLAEVTVVLALLGPTLIGVLMARAGLLDRPWEHVRVLRRTAMVGIPLGLMGGAPYALTVGGFWSPSPLTAGLLGVLHVATGVAAGVGYIALFGLWAARRRTRGPVTRALAATGERSLTCYLWQSVVFAPLLSAWGLGLGDRLGTTAGYGLAVAVWASSVVLAVVLARTGRRGPAEVLLRRLTYGRSGHATRPRSDRPDATASERVDAVPAARQVPLPDQRSSEDHRHGRRDTADGIGGVVPVPRDERQTHRGADEQGCAHDQGCAGSPTRP